mmetsp:Transcript_27029/g.108176  ORF Transcript_27029/g.108176 Transcript_27029/m.108176 type:complete len:211 (-) Transcript_27029:1691-2323(-)
MASTNARPRLDDVWLELPRRLVIAFFSLFRFPPLRSLRSTTLASQKKRLGHCFIHRRAAVTTTAPTSTTPPTTRDCTHRKKTPLETPHTRTDRTWKDLNEHQSSRRRRRRVSPSWSASSAPRLCVAPCWGVRRPRCCSKKKNEEDATERRPSHSRSWEVSSSLECAPRSSVCPPSACVHPPPGSAPPARGEWAPQSHLERNVVAHIPYIY